MFWADVVVFLLMSLLFLVSFTDEEPIVDLTDINIVHILGLFLALCSCINDNVQKFVFGVNGPLDRVLFAYVGLKSMLLSAYFLVIWFVFFSHTTMPLLVECEGGLVLASSIVDVLSSRLMVVVTALIVLVIYIRCLGLGLLVSSGVGFCLALIFSSLLLITSINFFFFLVGALDCFSVISGSSSVGFGPSDIYGNQDFTWHSSVSGFRLSNFWGLILLLGFLFVVLFFSLLVISFGIISILTFTGLYSSLSVIRALGAWVDVLVFYFGLSSIVGLVLVVGSISWSFLISGGL